MENDAKVRQHFKDVTNVAFNKVGVFTTSRDFRYCWSLLSVSFQKTKSHIIDTVRI